MGTQSVHGLAIDVERVRAAIGGVPRVAYEAAHVYPLSAPTFTTTPGAAREMPAGGPERLYVHIPFCRYACTFCFYAKRVNTQRAEMQRYVDALKRELDGIGEGLGLRQMYVGGGTPTALPADLLDQVLAAVTQRWPLDPEAIHTVEGSPESVVPEHVEVMRRRGIGRTSLGVQTLDDGLLQSINRRHSASQALAACKMLVDSGLEVNVDLIYGFPGQGEEDFRRDLAALAELGPKSFTLYSLRLNEHTPLARVLEDVERLDLISLMRWRRFAETTMDDLGYEQTRVHMFVRRDQSPSRHHRTPSTNAFGVGREVGAGVSAYSHLGETIYRNHEAFGGYVERLEAGGSPVQETFALGPRERRTLFAARTLGDGRELVRRDYETMFGRPIEEDFGPLLERLHGAGLLAESEDRLTLSASGRLVYDLLTLAFYPDDARRWLEEKQTPRKRAAAAGERATV